MDDIDIAHIAGYFDGKGRLSVTINPEDGYRLGYRVQVTLSVPTPEDEPAMVGKLDAFAEEQHVKYKVKTMQNRHNFIVKEPKSIAAFLTPLLPYLVNRYQDANLMVEAVVPLLTGENDLTKRTVYELAGMADQLRQSSRGGQKATYDQDYFAEEWDLEATA